MQSTVSIVPAGKGGSHDYVFDFDGRPQMIINREAV
jgi:hypothetical protein